ncbi:hypothetical protein F5Y02DRAFT_426756 [Annulohypoxylon stygium]|nr:hypothetical protein F5Y02DRAFT_426756 [Annulohypoxylon stygium]
MDTSNKERTVRIPRKSTHGIQNAGYLDADVHLATEGWILVDSEEDEPMEEADEPMEDFGCDEQTLRNQEIINAPGQTKFAGFESRFGQDSATNIFGHYNYGGSSSPRSGSDTSMNSGSDDPNSPGRGGGSDDINLNNFFRDNPRLPNGPNRTTVGVEFELAMAVSRVKEAPDSHPNDGRWLSENLVDTAMDWTYRVTVRNHLIDTLRKHGITANKTKEKELDVNYVNRSPLLNLEDGKQCPNFSKLVDWEPYYEWDERDNLLDNCKAAAQEMSEQFVLFHVEKSLDFYKTRKESLESIAKNKLLKGIQNISEPSDKLQDINNAVTGRWQENLEKLQKQFEKWDASHVDIDAVQVDGADPKYYAWTCSVDHSVKIKEADSEDYTTTSKSFPPLPVDDYLLNQEPVLRYRWWPGELKSPIYDYNNPASLETIRKVCAAVRDTYRTHKPLSSIPSGLHIHFGQEGGWTLLQLKKFSTFWLIAEELLERLHREDRSGNFWSMPLRSSCPIIEALRSSSDYQKTPHKRVRENLPDTKNKNPRLSYEYEHLKDIHVPFDIYAPFNIRGGPSFNDDIRDIITEIWQYDTITNLRLGLNAFADTPCVRWRVTGEQITNKPDHKISSFQTLEVRMMQGTLDADHVWRWMSICEGMVRFSRDSTPEQFRNGLRGMITLTKDPANVLDVPTKYFTWFRQRQNDKGYFEYPDKNKVDWSDPFMAPGYADVYTGLSDL